MFVNQLFIMLNYWKVKLCSPRMFVGMVFNASDFSVRFHKFIVAFYNIAVSCLVMAFMIMRMWVLYLIFEVVLRVSLEVLRNVQNITMMKQYIASHIMVIIEKYIDYNYIVCNKFILN